MSSMITSTEEGSGGGGLPDGGGPTNTAAVGRSSGSVSLLTNVTTTPSITTPQQQQQQPHPPPPQLVSFVIGSGGGSPSLMNTSTITSSSSPPLTSSKGLRRMGSVKKQPFFMNLRVQLIDQLKTLDTRLETQVQLTNEIQEFFKKRAEVEMETSKALEKLARNLNTRHKEIKAKRDSSSSSATSTLTSGVNTPSLLSSSLSQSLSLAPGQPTSLQPWTVFNSQSSLSVCWQQLINDTKIQSSNHAILADIYSTEITQRLQSVSEDLQRIYKQCREIGLEAHEELLKVLHELHTSMKTYHNLQTETRTAEAKLKLVEAQRAKLEQQIPKEKLEKSKKMKLVEKEAQKRMHKFTDARFKSQKAKNEYILCMDAANAAVQKYFMEDLSDLIDCMDLGFYECVTRSLNMYVSSQDQIRRSLQTNMENMSKCVSSLDARLDKQKFLESHNTVFALPKKFEFVPPSYPYNKNTASIAEEDFTPDPPEIETSGFIRQELEQRVLQLHKRLDTLRIESDELWKTLETAENSLLEMITAKDYDTCSYFIERNNRVTSNEASAIKIRSDKMETDEFHLNKFRDYMLTMNRISRLQSKYEHIRKTLKATDPTSQLLPPSTTGQGPCAASTRAATRRKRIGQIQKFTTTRLFGGSLEEYLEATNQEIPLVMKSCIRVITLYGLHHQGIFRVSGSQVEINNFKEAFEKGEDPLADVTDASDINSVAGVLKLYARELREPLFPVCYFEQFMELAQLDSNTVFIARMRDLVKSLPRAVFIVLRYLFAFLSHLSEFSDENMMDPYNLAICFGPTLVPVPEDKDQVQYQNLVNELIKNVILYHDEIFVDIPDGVFYEKYISTEEDDDGGGGDDQAGSAQGQPHHQGPSGGSSNSSGGCGSGGGGGASCKSLSESSPVLKKSLSCASADDPPPHHHHRGGRKHSREDSTCSGNSNSSSRGQTPASFMSEEEVTVKKRTTVQLLSTSPLPNPPLSPVIKETVILNDDEEEEEEEEGEEEGVTNSVLKKPDFLEAVAQFDFSARSTRELSLKKGETLVLYAQVSSDWWKGANRNGDEGLIPDKYILLKIRDEDLPGAPPSHHHQHQHHSSSTSTPTNTIMTVPPPLTTPPARESSSQPTTTTTDPQSQSHRSNNNNGSSRSRTASDSLISNPIVDGGVVAASSSSSSSTNHQRSFSVSDDRAKQTNGTMMTIAAELQHHHTHQNGDANNIETKTAAEKKQSFTRAVAPTAAVQPPPSATQQESVPVPSSKSSSTSSSSSSSSSTSTPTAVAQQPSSKTSTFSCPSPSTAVKSNIQVWEQRMGSSSSLSSSQKNSPIHHVQQHQQQHQSSAPDLVMDLPTQQEPPPQQTATSTTSSVTSKSSQLLQQQAPVPPKFTDTSPSSSDESDSSEASSSASSSPSTPTRLVGSSGAEVFAKQKNATLKKRTQDVLPDHHLQQQQPQHHHTASAVVQPQQQQQSSWSSTAQIMVNTPPPTTMFTFNSTFNKPQVKVKPVVLSKPKLPSQFSQQLNKMDEDEEMVDVQGGGATTATTAGGGGAQVMMGHHGGSKFNDDK